MKVTEQLYQCFQERVVGVSGECYRTPKEKLIPLIKKVFAEKEIISVSVFESPLTQEVGLTAAGITPS